MVQLLLEQRAASRAMFSKDISTSITYCDDCQSLSWIKHTGMSGLLVPETAVIETLLFRLWNRTATNRKFAVPYIAYIVMISMYFFLHIHFFKCTHTHTDTQIVSLYNVLFWILRKHGPCLGGSPSDAFSHAMELLGSWTSWSPYAKTQGASKAV